MLANACACTMAGLSVIWPARWVLRGCLWSRAWPAPALRLVGGEKITVILIHEFKCPATASGHAGQGIISWKYR